MPTLPFPKRIHPIQSLVAITMAVICVRSGSAQEAAPVKAQVSQSTLTVDDRTLQPLRIRERWPDEHFVGNLILSLRDNTVNATSIASGEDRWLAETEDGLPLEWLTADSEVAYLRVLPLDEDGLPREDAGPPRVVRLDLETGQWLEPLAVPIDEQEAKYVNAISAVFVHENVILALNATTDAEAEWGGNPTVSHRLTGFGRDSTNVVWSRVYPSAGSREQPGAFLLGSWGPAYDGQGNELITRLGTNVLVCAGPMEDLMAIDPRDGSEVWTIPRIWEFRRGFIGPSVWSYYISRYGCDESDLELAESSFENVKDQIPDEAYLEAIKQHVDAARKRVEAQTHAIIAGPVVVPVPTDSEDENQYSIFVVVSRSDSEQWSGYLSECVVHEFDQDGEPIGIVTLPKMIQSTQFHVANDSVFWNSEDALARISAQRRGRWGLESSDLICRVTWREHPPFIDPSGFDAWMAQGWITNAVAFTDTHVIRPAGGGVVRNPDDHVGHFPISVIDLQSGRERQMTLHVPFEGTIPIPTNNYASSGGHWVNYAWFYVTMTSLEIRGNVLVVAMETDSEAFAVEFDLHAIEMNE